MTLRIELPDDFEMKKDDEIIIRFNSKAGQHGYSVITKTQDEMEKKYSMLESDFIAHSIEINPVVKA